MLKLAAEENRIAKERYADAKAAIDELEKAKAGEGAKDTVTQELSTLRLAIDAALKANTAVDDTLRRGAAFTASTAGHFPFVAPPRRPVCDENEAHGEKLPGAPGKGMVARGG
jgi:hypothetical protein